MVVTCDHGFIFRLKYNIALTPFLTCSVYNSNIEINMMVLMLVRLIKTKIEEETGNEGTKR
jgi:hypothetical protein